MIKIKFLYSSIDRHIDGIDITGMAPTPFSVVILGRVLGIAIRGC